jgi:non-ribosomal peptide synthetase component F
MSAGAGVGSLWGVVGLSNWNYADVWETVADVQPESIAVTQGDRNVTWREFDRGADGIAQFLLDLGTVQQDKVAVYLYNSPEYLQATFAAVKVGLVPVNTNYRYGDDELSYLWENADAVAVVFHGAFTDRIEGILDRVPGVRGCSGSTTARGPVPIGPRPTRTPPSPPSPGWPRRGDAAVTISTCSTPAAPPACPRV